MTLTKGVTAALLALLLTASSGTTAKADGRLVLTGDMVQGGLLQGTAPAGTQLKLEGKAIRVSPGGRFLIGLGRDAPKILRLDANYPDGATYQRTLDVRQRTYRIQRIGGLPRRKVTPSPEDLKRIIAEGKKITSARALWTDRTDYIDGFVWPAKGRLSGVYGSQRILNGEPRRPHLGIDIAAPKGTAVVAAAAGNVTLAEPDLFFTGGTIVVDHGHGLSSVYSHLSRIGVEVGDSVSAGKRIGDVGSTGRSTGPHLDFRINLYQERLDPLLLLPPRSKRRK